MSVHAMPVVDEPMADVSATAWSYEDAFSRNRGLISAAEQVRLRGKRVAIAGMGGVGGIHLVTLARLGIGSFHIADPDRFELVNFNRQQGATVPALGRRKATVMARQARDINPELELRVFPEAITANNIAAFLDGVDVLIDGIDFFALDARRLVYREARRRGIWAIMAGPLGFSTAWLVFDPKGMSLDEYFDFHDGQGQLEQVAAFAIGLAPRATHWKYMDLTQIDPRSGRGPSVGLACQMCAGVAATEAVKILLGRGPIRAAPWHFQFDAYWQVLRAGYQRWGNRHPWQRFKRWLFARRLRQVMSAPRPTTEI